jgi:hypothetical protein
VGARRPAGAKKIEPEEFSRESFGPSHSSYLWGIRLAKRLLEQYREKTAMRICSTQARLGGASRRLAVSLVLLLAGTAAAQTQAQPQLKIEKKYPALTEFMMPRDAEIALARSAGPEPASSRATIKILTASGFKVAIEGDNGFACLVMRGWGAPTYNPEQFRDFIYVADLRAPICFDSVSARTIMPYYELRHRLGLEGKTADEIAKGVEAAYAKGELPKVEPSIGYMLSRDMYLGPHLGHDFVYPHIMLFLPYYTNATLGGNERRSGLPFLSDDSGTPFAVTVIPIDKARAISAKVN